MSARHASRPVALLLVAASLAVCVAASVPAQPRSPGRIGAQAQDQATPSFVSASQPAEPPSSSDAPASDAPASATPRPAASLQPLPSLEPVRPLDPDGARPRLSKEVVAYLPHWVATSRDAPYDPWTDPYIVDGRLSDIVLFSVGIRRNGSLKLDTPGAAFVLSPRAAAIIDAAHAQGIRVLVSFTSGGYKNNASLFGDQRAMDRFVAEATALVQARGLDGADMDIEQIQGEWFDAYAKTAGALKDSLTAHDPLARVMVATNGARSGARMARRALRAGADRAFLMGYAYRGPTSSPVGTISPLDRADDGLDLRDSIQLYRDRDVPMDQVIIGLPAYGLTYATLGPERLAVRAPARVSERGRVTLFRNVGSGVPTEGRIADEDLVEGSARIAWYDADRGSWFQTFYDTPATLRAKYVLAHEADAAGIGIWTLGYDAGLAGYPELVGQIFSRPVVGSVTIDPVLGATTGARVAAPTYDGLSATAGIRLSNDGIRWSPWMDPALLDPARDGPFDWTLAPGLDGPRTVHVQSRDLAGEMSVAVTAGAFVDRAPPVIEGFSLRPAPVPGWIAQYVATDEGGIATTQIRWQFDDAAWSAWQPLDSLGAGSTITSADTRVRAELRVTDQAGRTTTATTEASGWEHP